MPELSAFLSSVAGSIIWALIGVILLLGAFKIFDAVDPIAYHEEIKKGNTAAGIVVAGVMIGMSLIIYAAIR
jgi:putative membrane protein